MLSRKIPSKLSRQWRRERRVCALLGFMLFFSFIPVYFGASYFIRNYEPVGLISLDNKPVISGKARLNSIEKDGDLVTYHYSYKRSKSDPVIKDEMTIHASRNPDIKYKKNDIIPIDYNEKGKSAIHNAVNLNVGEILDGGDEDENALYNRLFVIALAVMSFPLTFFGIILMFYSSLPTRRKRKLHAKGLIAEGILIESTKRKFISYEFKPQDSDLIIRKDQRIINPALFKNKKAGDRVKIVYKAKNPYKNCLYELD